MRARKNDVMRFYNMVKDKVIRERLIKNYDEKFNEFIIINDARKDYRKLYEYITEWFSWSNSPQWHGYWNNIADKAYNNKLELKTLTYDL